MPARMLGLLFWGLVGVVAAGVLVMELRYPPRLRAAAVASAQAPAVPEVSPAIPFRLPPPVQYSEIALRPLFIATRRPEEPPPVEAPPPEKPPAPPGPEKKFLLFGVLITPGVTAALLRPEEPNARTVRVRLGEMLGEWRLEEVFPNRVVLRKGQATQELALARPKRPAGPRAGRAGAKKAQDPVPPASVPAVSQPGALPPPIMVPAPPPPQNDG